MKAPAHVVPGAPASAARPTDAQRALTHQRWRQRLLRLAGVLLAVAAVSLAIAVLDHAEGDLRQVRAPAFETLSTRLC